MKLIRKMPLVHLCILGILCTSCYKEVSEEFVGNWETDLIRVEIPLKEVDGSEDLVFDSVSMGLLISADKTASGYIGMASFTDVRVMKNTGDAENKGLAYVVKCGELGKIFPNDPVVSKKIEIWLKPVEGSTMGTEINYKWGDWFPFMIADPEFQKVE